MAAASFNVAAQELYVLPNAMFDKASEDGHYLVQCVEGEVLIFDAWAENEEDAILYFESDYDEMNEYYTPYYSLGFGNIFSENGLMVGCIDACTPGYLNLEEGEWIALPIREGDANPAKNNHADAITPDGSRICGGIALSNFGTDAADVMMAPVIWDRKADGTYGEYQVLPYPTKDLTGRVPQYCTARWMSDDGRTIAGTVTDYSGFIIIPIVYRQNAKGEWSYELLAEELIYNTEAKFPDYPTYEPKYVNPEKYLNEAEMTAFEAASKAYNDSLSAAYSGEADYPSYYPYATDFMVENLTQYSADTAVFNKENKLYQDSLEAFNDVFYDSDVVYNTSFEFNGLSLSRDGKYVSHTLHMEDPNPDPLSWFPEVLSVPHRFNLQAEGNPVEVCKDQTKGLISSTLNDGRVLILNDGATRNTYVWPVGTSYTTSLYEFIRTKNQAIGDTIQKYFTFSLPEYDEEWNVTPGEPQIYMGTAAANGVANLFYGFMINDFVNSGDWYIISYVVDLTKDTFVKQICNDLDEVKRFWNLNGCPVSAEQEGLLISEGKKHLIVK